MIDVDTFYKIKQLYHDGHLRVRIAEQLHLNAKTVSKWIQRDTYSQRTGPRRSKIGASTQSQQGRSASRQKNGLLSGNRFEISIR